MKITAISRGIVIGAVVLARPAISSGQSATSAPPQEAKPQGHAVRDNAINYFMLFDQFEWQRGDSRDGLSWDNKGWIGRDRDRFWFSRGQLCPELYLCTLSLP